MMFCFIYLLQCLKLCHSFIKLSLENVDSFVYLSVLKSHACTNSSESYLFVIHNITNVKYIQYNIEIPFSVFWEIYVLTYPKPCAANGILIKFKLLYVGAQRSISWIQTSMVSNSSTSSTSSVSTHIVHCARNSFDFVVLLFDWFIYGTLPYFSIVQANMHTMV